MHKIFLALFGLYVTSLATSNAGMEIAGGLFNFLWLGGFLFYFLRKSPQPYPYQPLGPDKWLWAYWAIGLAGAFVLPNLSASARLEVFGEFRWIWLFYSVLAVTYYLGSKSHLEKWLNYLLILGSLVALYSCFQVFYGLDFRTPPALHKVGDSDLFRAKGLFKITMTYSYSFGMLFMVFLAYLLGQKNKLRSHPNPWLWRVLIFGLVIMGASLLMTFTRGLWLALTLALPLVLFLFDRKLFKRFAVLALVALALTYSLSPFLRSRVNSIVSLENQSNYQRIDIWKANLAMFMDHPLVGVGYGRNYGLTQEYNLRLMGREGFVGHAHNHFLEVLSGTGALGFLCFLMIFGSFFRQALSGWNNSKASSLTRSLALGSLGAQIVFHVGGLTEAVMSDNECLHMFIFIHCLFLAQTKLDNKSQGLTFSTSNSSRQAEDNLVST